MKRIVPEELSARYRVIPADRCDRRDIYRLYKSNEYYFEYFSIEPTEERLYRDMTMRPDGCSAEQKHFLAYCDGDPIAILDLIEGYPDDSICYIGLFMVRVDLTGQGIGSSMIFDLCKALGRMGFESIRLAYGKNYDKAARFWTKNGFIPIREALHEEYGELIVADRNLFP